MAGNVAQERPRKAAEQALRQPLKPEAGAPTESIFEVSLGELGLCRASLDQLIFKNETLFQAQPEIREQRGELFG